MSTLKLNNTHFQIAVQEKLQAAAKQFMQDQ